MTEPVIRPLTSQDQRSFATFECRSFGEPWTDLIEEMVREHLGDSLERNDVEALGLWVGECLVAVVVWRPYASDLDVFRGVLLAVQLGYRRRGYGTLLKKHLIDHARQAGARAIVSEVHWDNNPIIELNVRLGARIERKPDDSAYCFCIIPLPS